MLAVNIRGNFEFSYEQWRSAFGYSVAQSFISALLTLVFGAIGGLGLLSWPRSSRKIAEVLLLLPSLVPTLFIMLALFNFFQWMGQFPFGFWGIVLSHTVINMGMISVLVSRMFKRSFPIVSDGSLVIGISNWRFYWHAGFLMNRKEWALMFFYLFALFMASFSVPLLAGRVEHPVIEMLIFEKIKNHTTWSEAMVLSVLQMGFLILVGLLVARPQTNMEEKGEMRLHQFAPSQWSAVVGVGVTILLLFSNLSGLRIGWQQWVSLDQGGALLLSLVLGTISVAAGVGIGVLILTWCVLWVYPSPKFQFFLLTYVSPSAVLTGFALLLLPPWEMSSVVMIIKMILGVVLLSFPICYRMILEKRLSQLRSQYEAALVLGGSQSLIVGRILWPQIRQEALLVAGLSAFWACGDYALSSVVAGRDLTLALTVKSLLGSYRLEFATFLSWVMIFLGVVFLMVFWKGYYVIRKKSF